MGLRAPADAVGERQDERDASRHWMTSPAREPSESSERLGSSALLRFLELNTCNRIVASHDGIK
jgi:hypothetical protein